ncbi:glycoside hydrolase family 88 protein [Chitinophaga horti]|uniref:Glycoside hydrolase family 88 protein n=1 Tax=Chitinophaga horti TaxID=2920382 RepID=A0ABY6JBU6_9BACT|nr:glycoside hydrolase family 88 protein [Chitinophaga horti]UYQ95882.1 glycoside hydrolase family 88 protein [Chitinophaga horti]
MKNILVKCLLVLMLAPLTTTAQQDEANRVKEIIHRVNTNWQSRHKPQVRSFWDNAVYHTGNMEAYFLTKNEQYRQYSEDWAIHNEWKGAKSNDTAKWKYSYGETDEYVLFGDYQICFQTYIDLYNIAPADYKVQRAKDVMHYQVNTPRNNYWWWCDALYMVMPVLTKLHQLTEDPVYLDKLYEYYVFSDSLMLDRKDVLYYRDAKYIYPKHRSSNGGKDFWSRGNGWVFAGLAKVLKDVPDNYKHKKFFRKRFRQMAASIAKQQQAAGYWTRSLQDPAHAPGAETSGTALFTYGYLWGVNNGYLSAKKYKPVIAKAWQYLEKTALQEDGRIGYVQPIGEKAIPGQVVNAKSEANFGVGAFLLAASEYVRFLEK